VKSRTNTGRPANPGSQARVNNGIDHQVDDNHIGYVAIETKPSMNWKQQTGYLGGHY